AGAGAGCPVLCTCRGQAVDCSGQRLFSVPPELPLDTGNLSLAHNRIASIPPGYLACYGQLRALDLRNNSLAALPAGGAFRGLAQLRELDLSYGGLSAISLDALEGLPGLVGLRLGGNPWVCGCAMEPFLKWLRGRIQRCASGSFQACHLTLTLDDYLFIAFVGFVVSIASVATNFLLGITANCCHRWSKASEDEDV
ncbi:LRC55 protein, partial [Sagittarius serpentarius]|nr:LRC55 protein [Sagittarius serpentarius]